MKNYIEKVWSITQKIPEGKVTTYGEIGKKLQISPRIVGYALHQNKSGDVPCHRVVNREGRLATNFAFGGAHVQQKRLSNEGVKFKDNMHVDLKKHFYSLKLI